MTPQFSGRLLVGLNSFLLGGEVPIVSGPSAKTNARSPLTPRRLKGHASVSGSVVLPGAGVRGVLTRRRQAQIADAVVRFDPIDVVKARFGCDAVVKRPHYAMAKHVSLVPVNSEADHDVPVSRDTTSRAPCEPHIPVLVRGVHADADGALKPNKRPDCWIAGKNRLKIRKGEVQASSPRQLEPKFGTSIRARKL